MKCDCCGHDEPTLEEIYDGYWNSVKCMIEQGHLPKDFVEKEIKETMRQAELMMKLSSGDFSKGTKVKFTRHSPLSEAE